MVRFASLAALALLASSLPVPARAAGAPLPPEPGVWWDLTMEMTMRLPGTPQPQAHTSTERECLPKKPPDRPPPQSGHCTFADFKRSGPRVTFRLTCQDGVTGEADLLWTSDTYSGTTIMRGQGMENRIKVKGKTVGGDCDANEEERQELAEAEAAAEGGLPPQERERMCADAAASGDPTPFLPAEPGAAAECKDATRFCASLETRRGLVQLRQAGLEDGVQQAAKLCKKDVAALERRHCAALAKEPARKVAADEETSEFVFASCPDLARSMAKRSCAGRSFTGMPLAQRDFCTRWAQEALQGR